MIRNHAGRKGDFRVASTQHVVIRSSDFRLSGSAFVEHGCKVGAESPIRHNLCRLLITCTRRLGSRALGEAKARLPDPFIEHAGKPPPTYAADISSRARQGRRPSETTRTDRGTSRS